MTQNAEYVRQLEDACLILWAELPAIETVALVTQEPALAEFLRHLHHSVEHQQAMVRVNVWANRSSCRPAHIDGSGADQ